MKKLSRLESNKEVRRVLNRHGADLTLCQYSCAGLEVRLTGWLCRIDGTEYNPYQIESLIHDFQRRLKGYFVQGDLDNWNFTSDRIRYLVEKNNNNENVLPDNTDQDDYEEVG
jgi:hypothetical protein